ncbi:glycosyltransferase [Micromonospora chersina]|uniref:glycosyltransferase n=1 Tax=Micromonospora chersina TaxID=47854 RepID=UPI0037126A93
MALRVTYVIDGDTWGGAEAVLRSVIPHLPEAAEVCVVATSQAVAEQVCDGAEARVLLVQGKRKTNPLGVLAWRRAIASTRPDIVHINLQSPLAALHAQLAAASLPKVRRVHHEHMPVQPKTLVHIALKRLLSLGAAEVAVSDRSAEDLSRGYGLPRSKIAIVPNGVRPADVVPKSGDGRQLVCVGRLTPQKGFDVAIRALAELPGYRLRIVGARTARDAESLEAVARQSGVEDRVTFLPWCESISEALAGADIVLMPSRFEAAPLVLLEALVRGFPVVASDVGNTREVLELIDGKLVVRPDDISGLARAVAYLGDPSRRKEIGEAGRSLIMTRYGEASTANGFINMYRRLLPA